MMRIIAVITAVMFFAFSSVASTNVKAGDVVQEDGVLLTQEEAAKIVAEKRVSVERCEEKVEHAKKVTLIEEQLKIKNLQTDLRAEKDKSEAIITLKDKEIDRLYKQIEDEGGDYDAYFMMGGMAVGVVLTAAISTAIFFAAVQTAKSQPVLQ